jgi:tryptophanyl-tRNA synthetase
MTMTSFAPARGAALTGAPGAEIAAQFPALARPVALSGDRPTGPLHLGHLAGALHTRVRLQDHYRQFVLIADGQALTDGVLHPAAVAGHVIDVALDYLACGIDPARTTLCVQSQLPELAELTMLLLNVCPLGALRRNPTVRAELRERGLRGAASAGFFVYPVSQAADITGFRADVVPTGDDQLPVLELTNTVVRRFNRDYAGGESVLREVKPLLSRAPRLPGIDGRAKMSKTLGNAIALRASPDEIRRAVHRMYTDPGHVRVEDPGRVEGNVVFAHLRAFDADGACVAELEDRYQRGGVADSALKERLDDVLQALLAPIRERRARLAADRSAIGQLLDEGSARARAVVAATLRDVRTAMRRPGTSYGT